MIGARRRLPPRRRMVIPGLTRMSGGPHPRRRDRSGVDEPQTWRPGLLIWALTLLTGFAVLLYVVWLSWSIYVIVHGEPSALPFDPDRRCAPLGFTCGAISKRAIRITAVECVHGAALTGGRGALPRQPRRAAFMVPG